MAKKKSSGKGVAKLKGKLSHYPKRKEQPSKGSVGSTGSVPKTATKIRGNK